jgi:acetyl esterase/lipase
MIVALLNKLRKCCWNRQDSTPAASVSATLVPHSKWYHPHKTFLETALTFFLGIYLALDKMITCPTVIDEQTDPKKLKPLIDFRKMHSHSIYEMALNEMRQKYQWEGKPCLRIVPRKQNILLDWGIIKDYSPLSEQNHESLYINRSNMVPVYIHGPSTIITEAKSPDIDEPHTEEMSQASNLKTCLNLSHNQSVPIVLWFHGGGLVVGSAADNRALAYVRDVLDAQGRKRKQRKVVSAQGSDNTSKVDVLPTDDILLITVDYALAPENPFPCGLIDCLSVVDYLIQFFPSHPIHLAGESAGANLTAVVALECARKYPGRISSAYIIQPMCSPATDTLSYHMNAHSSFLTGEWLRWCWRSYLSLDIDTTSHSKGFLCEFHRNSFLQSKWMTSGDNWQRLFAPQTELPSKDALEMTSWVIITSKADLLYDEGYQLAMELLSICETEAEQNKKNITYIETNGDHVTGLLFDKEKYSHAVEAVRQHLFSDSLKC